MGDFTATDAATEMSHAQVAAAVVEAMRRKQEEEALCAQAVAVAAQKQEEALCAQVATAAAQRRKQDEDMRKKLGELLGQQACSANALCASVDQISSSVRRVGEMHDTLEASMSTAQDKALRASIGVRHMLGEFQLHKRKPQWVAAAKALQRSGEGGTTESASHTVMAQQLIAALEAGEAGHPVHAACVLMRHIEANASAPAGENPTPALRVVAAAPGALQQLQRAKPGAVWRASSTHPVSIDAHAVLMSGKALLRSHFGDSQDAISLVPLKGRGGATIGVVVSGAPAYPDSFLQSTCEVAGRLLERSWRLERVQRLLTLATDWLGRHPVREVRRQTEIPAVRSRRGVFGDGSDKAEKDACSEKWAWSIQ